MLNEAKSLINNIISRENNQKNFSNAINHLMENTIMYNYTKRGIDKMKKRPRIVRSLFEDDDTANEDDETASECCSRKGNSWKNLVEAYQKDLKK